MFIKKKTTAIHFFAGVVDTAEQFIAVFIDTGNKLFIHLQISPQIFDKIKNGPNGILGGLGDTVHEKNLKLKISCQTPFNKF